MILFHCFFQVAFTGSTEVGHIIQQAAGASNLKVGSTFKSDIVILSQSLNVILVVGLQSNINIKKNIYIGANLERATHL